MQLTRATSYGAVSEKIVSDLSAIVGAENLSTSEHVREQHGKDESYHSMQPPDAVVFPTTAQQVQEVAR